MIRMSLLCRQLLGGARHKWNAAGFLLVDYRSLGCEAQLLWRYLLGLAVQSTYCKGRTQQGQRLFFVAHCDRRKIALTRRGAEDSTLVRRGERNNVSVCFSSVTKDLLTRRSALKESPPLATADQSPLLAIAVR